MIFAVTAVAVASTVVWLTNRSAYGPSWLPPGEPVTLPGGRFSDYGYESQKPSMITFRDDAESNWETKVPLDQLTVIDESLEPVTISEIRGDRNLLLVVIRGAPLCPYCAAQTSRLVNNYQKFSDLGAEVAVVFPGSKEDLQQLVSKAKLDDQELPFPLLVDPDLAAVKRLDIEANRARPSSFIIDRHGRTQFAYVGANDSDRPSIQALLTALERIQPDETDSSDPATDESSNEVVPDS